MTGSPASFVSGASRVAATGMKDHQSSISDQLGHMQMQLNASANDVSVHEELSCSYCGIIDQLVAINLDDSQLKWPGIFSAFISREYFDFPLLGFIEQSEFQPRAPPY